MQRGYESESGAREDEAEVFARGPARPRWAATHKASFAGLRQAARTDTGSSGTTSRSSNRGLPSWGLLPYLGCTSFVR